MARARLAAYAALMVVLLLGGAAWPPHPTRVPIGARGGGRLAALGRASWSRRS